MKNKFALFIKFLAFSLLFFLLSRASLQGVVFPFAYGMLFALAWANQKIWLLAPAYLLGSLANNFSFEGFIIAISTLSLLAIPYYIHIAVKKPMKKWELFVLAAISQVGYLVFAIISSTSPILIAVHFVFGLCVMWLEVLLFEALIVRGLSYKLTITEMVAAGMILMFIACGLESCSIYGFSLLKMFVAFLILTISHISSPSNTMIFSSLMGIGGMIGSGNPLYIAPFMLYALAVIIFKKSNKNFSSIAIVLVEVLSTYYLGGGSEGGTN